MHYQVEKAKEIITKEFFGKNGVHYVGSSKNTVNVFVTKGSNVIEIKNQIEELIKGMEVFVNVSEKELAKAF